MPVSMLCLCPIRGRWARQDLKEEAEAVARELAAKEEAAKVS